MEGIVHLVIHMCVCVINVNNRLLIGYLSVLCILGIAKSFDEQVFPHSDLIKAYFNDIPYIEGDPVFKMTLVSNSIY